MPTAAIRPKDLIIDLPAETVGPEAWTFGQNVLMSEDRTLTALGPQRVWGDPLARPVWGNSAIFGANKRVLYAGSAGLYGTDGTNHATITPAAGFGNGAAGQFTGGMFNGIFVANEPSHAPCYWGGNLANIALPLPGYPVGDRARAMRPFKYFLVQCGGTVNGADGFNTVRWSTSAAPGLPPTSWTPLSTNDAGEVPLAGAREPLIDMAPLRDSLLVFEPHATWQLAYIGGAFVFSNRRILHTAGLLSPNAWGVIGSEILFLSDGDLLLTDGQSVRSVINRRLRTAMFSQIARDAVQRAFIAVTASRSQAVIAFPSGGATYCNKAVIWNYGADKMGIVDLPDYSYGFSSYLNSAVDTWAGDSESWDGSLKVWDYGLYEGEDAFLVGCRPDYSTLGAFEATNRTESPSDGPLEVIARKEKMMLDADGRVKQVTRLRPRMEGPDGCQVYWRIGTSMDPGQPTSWQPERLFTIGHDDKVDVRATGRFVSVQVRSQTVRAWSCSGFDLEFQDAGGR